MIRNKTWARQISLAAALATMGTFAMAGIAAADDISNDLDTSIDAVAEVMPLNVGGANGTTSLYVQPQGGDGKPGCNLTGSTTLTLAVSSSNTAVATVSPSSVTFTSCGETKTLTVSPVAQGSATVSVAQTSNTTGGTFNLAPATFTVNVAAPANSAPTVSVEGVTGGASYDKGSVPGAMCQVTDADDGNSSFPATLSAITGDYAQDGIGSQTASCSYTDRGGITASASETYTIVDPSAPTIGYVLDPSTPDGDNDWYRGEVTLTWTVTEDESPSSLTQDCVDQVIDADQAETTYTCSASSAGGDADDVSVTIKRDGTAPAVSYTSADGTAGLNDWYTSPVTATFTATDALSGPASQTAAATSGASEEGPAVRIDSPAFTDNAGNTTEAGAVFQTFGIDWTAPEVEFTSLSAATGTNGWYTSPAVATFTGTDAVSGPAFATATADTGSQEGEGLTIDSPAFSDQAGNQTAAGAAVSPDVKVDLSLPDVPTFVDGPADEEYFGSVPSAPSCTSRDEVSGLKDCVVTGYSTAVGTHTMTATATDNAGWSRTATRTYTVLPWTGKGFYAPVDMNGVWNSVKGGSTVPLKFELFAGATELTNTSAITSFVAKAVACPNATAPTDEIETVLTGGTSLRYDTTAGQFVQNWQTPKKPGTCATATITTQDGGTITANFKFK